jgi:Glycerol-3-phosphate acyltransferase
VYGSLPFVYLLGRQRNIDLHQVGSGNVGSTNLWTAGGRARGAIGWIADASKGLVPIAMARRLGCDERTAELAGVCGVAGQCWPVFLRFNGGRGISAFVGASFLIDRAAWVAALVPMVAGSLWHMGRRRSRADRLQAKRSKSVPLGCVVGTLMFPLVYRARRQGTRVAGRRDACRAALGWLPIPAAAGEGGQCPAGTMAWAPGLLTLVILLRRLTAPLPDDARHGPAVRPQALVYRLLYDRNTSS